MMGGCCSTDHRNGLIFDVDGVLADTEALIADATAAMFREFYGVDLTPEDFRPFIGTGAVRYTVGPAEKLGIAIDVEKALQRRHDNFVALINERETIAMPGAAELLAVAAASGAWKLAIATSAPQAKFRETLQAAKIPFNFFSAIVTGDHVEKKKPDPEIYLAAADRLGLPPTRCVVVEDAIMGVQAAKAAGMACIALTGSFPAEDLAAADIIVDSLCEIGLDTLRSLLPPC